MKTIEELLREEHARNLAQNAKGVQSSPIIDARAIFNGDYPEPEFVISDLLLRGTTILAGRPKIGKSWLALQLALSVARKSRALGRFEIERPGGVLYYGLEESPRRTKSRLRRFIERDEPYLENLRMAYRLPPLLNGGVAELDKRLADFSAQLLVIDTLLAVVRAGGNRDLLRSDYYEMKALCEIAEKHRLAVLVIHHLRKMPAGGYALDAVAGTTGLTASADSIWTLTPEAEGNCKLTVQGRDMENRDYELTFRKTEQDFGWQVLAEGAECGLSRERRDILTILQQEGAKKPSDVARLLGNKNVVTVRRLIQEMVRDGVIRRQSNGTYVPVVGASLNTVNGVNGTGGVNGAG